ncbi:hypothetical protein L873DRAFT_1928572 [Choiromyces venosus 120613-1]|uniref:Uncharacterized protein n=1 Tax=Choiromyces venosus 120613-1 TaxID=1336337 RepID=A0A3N4K2Z0_9PEZI|nr:hypothetical protein L873DRAFT_1928572 [Choiromyces venosus 120613-1]
MATFLTKSIINQNLMIAPEADTKGGHLDAGSIIRYKSNPAKQQPEGKIVPHLKIKQGKKATALPKEYPNRSSLPLIATDKNADSLGNSGDETDTSYVSAKVLGRIPKRSVRNFGRRLLRAETLKTSLRSTV